MAVGGVQLFHIQPQGRGNVNVQLNIGGMRFNTGSISKRMVEISQRVVAAAVIIAAITMYTQYVIFGLTVGVFAAVSGNLTPKRAHQIFQEICRSGAVPQLGIALAAYFVAPLVVCPMAALVGSMAMTNV